jgi:hypothetical protein
LSKAPFCGTGLFVAFRQPPFYAAGSGCGLKAQLIAFDEASNLQIKQTTLKKL